MDCFNERANEMIIKQTFIVDAEIVAVELVMPTVNE